MLQDRKTLFNALAEQYDAYRPHYPPEALLLLVTLGELDRTKDVADIGTGTGQIALELGRYVRVVHAIDTAAAMLDRLGEHARELGLTNVFVHEVPAADTGLHDESIDLAVMAQSFHWVDKQSALKEFNPSYRGGADIVSADFKPAIDDSGLFTGVERFVFPFELTYNPESYLGYLLSKSYIGVGIAADRLPEFIQHVHGFLKENFPSGRIVEQYETVLLLANKKD